MAKGKFDLDFCRTMYVCFIIILFFNSTSIVADPLSKRVRLGVYMSKYERFPEANGIMWADSVALSNLEKLGYQVEIIPLPARRLPKAIVANQIDIYVGSLDAVEDQELNLTHSMLPIVVVNFFIYYDIRKNWKPTWPPNSSIRSRAGVSALSAQVLRDKYNLNLEQSKSYESSVKMVHAGRVDYWLENRGGMRSLPADTLRTRVEGFTLDALYTKPIFAITNNTAEGKKLVSYFNEQFLKLLRDRNYAKVFYSNAVNTDGFTTVNETIQYIQTHHPDLNIQGQFEPPLENVDLF